MKTTNNTTPTLIDLLQLVNLVHRIYELRQEGWKHREINQELNLPDFQSGSSYRIMKSKLGRSLVTLWENN